MFDESRSFGFNQKPIKVDFWQSKDDLKYEQEEKNHACLTQLVNLVVNQSKMHAPNHGMYRAPYNRGNSNNQGEG